MDQHLILPYPIIRKILSELDFVTFLENPTTIYLMMTYKTEKKLEWKYFTERAMSSLSWRRRIRNKEYDEIYDLDPIQVIFTLVHRKMTNEVTSIVKDDPDMEWGKKRIVIDQDGRSRSRTKITNINLVGSHVTIYDSVNGFWIDPEGELEKRCFAFCMLIKNLIQTSQAWDDIFSE